MVNKVSHRLIYSAELGCIRRPDCYRTKRPPVRLRDRSVWWSVNDNSSHQKVVLGQKQLFGFVSDMRAIVGALSDSSGYRGGLRRGTQHWPKGQVDGGTRWWRDKLMECSNRMQNKISNRKWRERSVYRWTCSWTEGSVPYIGEWALGDELRRVGHWRIEV